MNDNYADDPWYHGDLIERPFETPSSPRDEPLYKTITGWLIVAGTGLVVITVLAMAIAVIKGLFS